MDPSVARAAGRADFKGLEDRLGRSGRVGHAGDGGRSARAIGSGRRQGNGYGHRYATVESETRRTNKTDRLGSTGKRRS